MYIGLYFFEYIVICNTPFRAIGAFNFYREAIQLDRIIFWCCTRSIIYKLINTPFQPRPRCLISTSLLQGQAAGSCLSSGYAPHGGDGTGDDDGEEHCGHQTEAVLFAAL